MAKEPRKNAALEIFLGKKNDRFLQKNHNLIVPIRTNAAIMKSKKSECASELIFQDSRIACFFFSVNLTCFSIF